MNINPSNKFLYVTDGTEAAMFQVSNVQPIVVVDADTLGIYANAHQLGGTAASDTFLDAVITVTANSNELMLALGKEIVFGSAPVIDVLALAKTLVPGATCAITLN
jgi:hypothetical protein